MKVLARKKIIVSVDDNREFGEVLKSYLEDETDLQLVHFTSSELALDFLARFPVGVVAIFSDIMMRNVDGFDFLDKVRAMPNMSQMPFLFISGVDASVFRDHFKKREYTAFLSKPLGYLEFKEALRKIYRESYGTDRVA